MKMVQITQDTHTFLFDWPFQDKILHEADPLEGASWLLAELFQQSDGVTGDDRGFQVDTPQRLIPVNLINR